MDDAGMSLLSAFDTHFGNYFVGKKGKSWSTVKNYRKNLEHFVHFLEKQGIAPTLSNFTEQQVVVWNLELQARVSAGLIKPKTYNRRINAVKSIARCFFKLKLLPANPGEEVTPPRSSKNAEDPARVLTATELERLLTATWGDLRTFVLVVFLYFTLARVSEVGKVRWRHVNFGAGTVYLPCTKGGKRNEVYINNASFFSLLQIYRPPAAQLDDYLFPGRTKRNGGKGSLDVSVLKHIIASLGKRAGVDVSPHDLRKTGATHLYWKTRDIVFVNEMLGHASLDTTRGYVQTKTTEYMLEELRRVEEVWERTGKIIKEVLSSTPSPIVQSPPRDRLIITLF